ncbi:MAG TPA: ZIP family metal transporter [Burkholderiales bacterium]|nr:ZIP family metal transporter [Burkholderiales bacterium]
MNALTGILVATVAGGALSATAAAAFAFSARPVHVPALISFAIGALLGAAFLEILPHAFETSPSPTRITAMVLAGILLFFVLEKLVLWRHCHEEQCEAHELRAAPHDHGRSGLMIMIGTTFHNFVDGILIATAFLADLQVGVVTAIAIITHEVPQEIGDFLVLLHSGYPRRVAFAVNILSSLAMTAGGVFAYFALKTMQQWIPPLLGLAAASMIYVAVADLIPGLHRRPELHATFQQVTLICAGIFTVWGVGALVRES